MTDIIEQGTAEWLAMRLGKVTASKISAVMAKGRSGAPSATRATYMGQLVAERLTGEPYESFKSEAMQHGTDTEEHARSTYEFMTDETVELVSSVDHPVIKMSSASPDGLIGALGLVEIKCPNTSTHIETLRGGKIKREYLLQMQWQMACTERQWCDFVSFDPRMPASMQMHIQRVQFDQDAISEIEQGVIEFLSDLDEMVAELTKKFEQQEEAA